MTRFDHVGYHHDPGRSWHAFLVALGFAQFGVQTVISSANWRKSLISLTKRCAVVVRVTSRILITILASPQIAWAQFSLVATQVGVRGEPQGESYQGHCAEDACRATLPVFVGGLTCVLSIRVSAPDRMQGGTAIFAAGPCKGKYEVIVDPRAEKARYRLDQFGAMTHSYVLPFLPKGFGSALNGRALLDDGVVRARPSAEVRLDIVATQPSKP